MNKHLDVSQNFSHLMFEKGFNYFLHFNIISFSKKKITYDKKVTIVLFLPGESLFFYFFKH